MSVRTCTRCGNKLSKPRLEAGKRKCYRCERASIREQKQRAHDRRIESEDFTAADYWQLYEDQDGHCAILNCRAQGKAKHLSVEHDHQCNRGHEPGRWCRDCVRGLTCSMHNEWIGRAGDSPDIFDSIADYLRNPPARKTLMDKMIVGNETKTVETLISDYKIPPKRARKITDLSRGVGPSPIPVHNGTIEVRYIRLPRGGGALYEIIESAPKIEGNLLLKRLQDEYSLSERRARSALNAAWRDGSKRVSTAEGIIGITYHGRGPNESYIFSVKIG